MRKTINISKNKYIGMYISTLFIVLIFIMFIFLYKTTKGSYGLSYWVNWLGILTYVYAIYSWRVINNDSWINTYMIFYTFFTLFNFGQPIMWAFGFHSDFEIGTGAIYYGANVFADEYHLLFVKLYICICMLLFHFGALLRYKSNTKRSHINTKKVSSTYKSIFSIGIILGVVSIPVTLYRTFLFFNVARLYGYKALYYSSHISQGGLSMIIEMFFFPALVCLLIGSQYKTKIRWFVYSVFIMYFLMNLLSGDRGSWLYKLIILIFLSSKYYKPINFKKTLIYAVLGLITLYIVNAIVSIRNIGFSNIELSDIVNFQSSPIIDGFFEMGGSMGIITYLLKTGNSIWPYGNTYLLAFVGMVSTKLSVLLGLPFVLVDNWFSQDYLGITWGAGFSMIGEAYLNSGLYGAPLVMMFLGFAIATLISIPQNVKAINSPIRYFIAITSLHTLIGFSRGSIYLYLKTLFYGTIVVSIMIIFMREIFIKKQRL